MENYQRLEHISTAPEKLGLDGSPTKVVKIFSPPARGGGEMLTGEPEEIVDQLVKKLKETVISVV